jgi:hypothetical protein
MKPLIPEHSPKSRRLPSSANPFAQNAELNGLRDDLGINVAKGERIASAIAGLALMLAGRYLRSNRAFLRRIIGAILMSRAATGHCPLYYLLGRDTRHYGEASK